MSGSIQSLKAVGIEILDSGRLQFDEAKFRTEFAKDPDAVKEFFTTEEKGFADKTHELLETLVGRDNSLLVNRARTLSTKVDFNVSRIEFFNSKLDRQRERLLLDFIRMETTVAKLQDNLTALQSIQVFEPAQAPSSVG